LGPGPAATPENIKAFVESKDLLSQLSVFYRKMADEYEWQSIPAGHHGERPLPNLIVSILAPVRVDC
jgi:hypothetical protein